jgi:hypothetical protein
MTNQQAYSFRLEVSYSELMALRQAIQVAGAAKFLEKENFLALRRLLQARVQPVVVDK